MKRKATSIVLLMCFMVISMISCTKEKEKISLVGKTFAATEYYGSYGTIFDPYTAYYVIRFTSETTIECADRKNSIHGPLIGFGKIVNGTYILNYPNIHLEYDDPTFYDVPSSHHSEDGIFVDETCFRIGNKDYSLH